MAALGRRLEPWLRRVHPGYFMVVLSLVITHGALAVDSLLPVHDAPIYKYIEPMLTPIFAVHVVIVVGLVVALYLPEQYWWIGRVACIVSLLTYNTIAALAIAAVLTGSHLSITLPAFAVALSMASAAAAREPVARYLDPVLT